MTQWEKEKILNLESYLNDLENQLSADKIEKGNLEKNEEVRQYMALLENEQVRRYICVKDRVDSLDSEVVKAFNRLKLCYQDVCLHHELLFLADVSDQYDLSHLPDSCRYYQCRCLLCDKVINLLFVSGKRKDTHLYMNEDLVDKKLVRKLYDKKY